MKVVPATQQGYKSQLQAEVDIHGKGFACSTTKGSKMFIGCKDGTLLELNCRTFKLEREMENEMPI